MDHFPGKLHYIVIKLESSQAEVYDEVFSLVHQMSGLVQIRYRYTLYRKRRVIKQYSDRTGVNCIDMYGSKPAIMALDRLQKVKPADIITNKDVSPWERRYGSTIKPPAHQFRSTIVIGIALQNIQNK